MFSRLTNAKDDFRGSVVSSADHRTMVLIVEGSRSEIDQVDLWAQEHPAELGRPRIYRARGRDVAVVGEGLVCVVEQQDVLGLEIGVNQVEIMQKRDAAEKLSSECLDVRARERHKATRLEEVEDRETE